MEINAHDLQKLIKAHADSIQLIDCREPEEWQQCRIEGSELIPLSQFAQATEGWDSSDQRKKVIYCHHGVRSLQATAYLRNKGFVNTYSLQGGIDIWSVEVDPDVPRY
jgi:rhodanese-related sulfurtransferase